MELHDTLSELFYKSHALIPEFVRILLWMHLMYYKLFTKVSTFYVPAFQWSETFNLIPDRGRQQQWFGNWSFIDLIEKVCLFSSCFPFSFSFISPFMLLKITTLNFLLSEIVADFGKFLQFIFITIARWNCFQRIIYIPDGLLMAIRKDNKVKLHESFELSSRMFQNVDNFILL